MENNPMSYSRIVNAFIPNVMRHINYLDQASKNKKPPDNYGRF